MGGGRISKPPNPDKAQPEQVQDTVKPRTTHQSQLKNKKLKDKSENYICNLYGWSAWWERVTRIIARPKKSLVNDSQKTSLAEKIRLSKAEKSRFVKRYFTNTEERDCRHEKSRNQDSDWPREFSVSSRATPKRFREEDKFSTGELNRSRKKTKTKIEEGVQAATTLSFFGTEFIEHKQTDVESEVEEQA